MFSAKDEPSVQSKIVFILVLASDSQSILDFRF